MISAALSPAPGSEFDAFLYAPILEEQNGTLLSMLSALARANLDPWDEAARLARLPHEAATRSLTALIAALPVRPPACLDSDAVVKRLIALLPKYVTPDRCSTSIEPLPASGPDSRALIRSWIFYIALMLSLLVNQWLIGRSLQNAAPSGSGASTPATHSPKTLAPVSAPAASPHS
jgi:hypothetical protein